MAVRYTSMLAAGIDIRIKDRKKYDDASTGVLFVTKYILATLIIVTCIHGREGKKERRRRKRKEKINKT